jgi:hypothetical protein
LTNAHGLFVLANCYTLAGFIFPGGSDQFINSIKDINSILAVIYVNKQVSETD